MTYAASLSDRLPGGAPDQPETGWIHTLSVGGEYGITAAVRDFAEVLDWQEHRRELTQGYYRLIHPPRLQHLKHRLERKYPGFTAVLYASAALAEKELRDLLTIQEASADTLDTHSGLPSSLNGDGPHVLALGSDSLPAGAVLVSDSDLAADLHERNRRRGGVLSARTAAVLLGDSAPTPDPADAAFCHDRLCDLEDAPHALFYPSGMGAVTAVLEEVLQPATPRMIVLGNVYRDTHLLLEEQDWAGRDVHTDFLDTHDLDGLRERLSASDVAGVFVETITNPLIEIPDLPAIADLCRAARKPLLVDSTMAGPLNAHPLDLGADVVIHSTSKYLSGNNVHGGGVVLTRDPAWANALEQSAATLDNRLSPLEYAPLAEGLRTFEARMARFNRNGEALAALLRDHPAVDTVHYGNDGLPDWLGGLGSVVSCDLREASMDKVAAFFDHPLPGLVKAPSLGSDNSLFCPYVLLAYYDKSEAYLRECNLSKWLLRFAAGSEQDFTPVLRAVADALDHVH